MKKRKEWIDKYLGELISIIVFYSKLYFYIGRKRKEHNEQKKINNSTSNSIVLHVFASAVYNHDSVQFPMGTTSLVVMPDI